MVMIRGTDSEQVHKEEDVETAHDAVLTTATEQSDGSLTQAFGQLVYLILSWLFRKMIVTVRKAFHMRQLAFVLIYLAKHVAGPLWHKTRLSSGKALVPNNVFKVGLAARTGNSRCESDCLEALHQSQSMDDRPPEYARITFGKADAPGSSSTKPSQNSGPSPEIWIATVVFCLMALHALMDSGAEKAYVNDNLQRPLRIVLIPAVCVASGFLCYIFVTGVAETRTGAVAVQYAE